MTNTHPESEGSEPVGLLDSHITPFLIKLRAAGFAEQTLKKKRSVASAFVKWAQCQKISLHQLNDDQIAAFLSRSPRKGTTRTRFEKSVLRLLLEHLRHEAGAVPDPPQTPSFSLVDGLVGRYVDYLRKDRGLAENSILVYSPFIRHLLDDQFSKTGTVSVRAFDATAIQSFLLDHIRERSSEYARLLATALRSFFRFLFFCGDLPRDLSILVPTVRKCRHAGVPAFLSSEEIDQLLAAADQSTGAGRRDYAILLLLARLGLRAGEIAALRLDDIRWRSSEIIIRGKGHMVEPLPLLSDVGEALVRYLQKDRNTCQCRCVFQRLYPPHVGLAGPAAIGHIVRLALARAGIKRSGRGAAHLLRHGLATQMSVSCGDFRSPQTPFAEHNGGLRKGVL